MRFPTLILLNHLLDEYISKRIEAEAKGLTAIATKFMGFATGQRNDLGEILKVCKELSEDFIIADQAQENIDEINKWIDIMLKLGDIALKAQKASNNSSEFCRTTHALRSYIFSRINAIPVGAETIALRISALETIYTKREAHRTTIQNDNKAVNRDKSLAIANDECFETIRQLAYLGHIHAKLKEDKLRTEIFANLEYPPKPDENALASNSRYDLDSTLPYVLHKEWIQIFIDRNYALNKAEKVDLITFENNVVTKQLEKIGIRINIPKFIKMQFDKRIAATQPSPPSSTDEYSEEDAADTLMLPQAAVINHRYASSTGILVGHHFPIINSQKSSPLVGSNTQQSISGDFINTIANVANSTSANTSSTNETFSRRPSP